MRLSYLVLLPLLSLVLAQDTDRRQVERAFDAANIPQDLNIKFEAEVLLEVSLPQTGGTSITLHAGVQLPRNATAGPPSFAVRGDVAGRGPFVVATVDPDAPTPQNPTSAQIRHFLGGNFVNVGGNLRNNTPAITQFRQPTPPAGSDAHRYIFLLFRQSPQFNSQTEVNSTSSTSLFDIAKFAADTGLGSPIGGTFMLVAPDA
ncbi:hypothetical protein E1B28_012708 [Marasmius oreades]|uniref:PEBP-like protein n=1 Tax=Marasmius oreades TaxID=181124 RepID=A0A9P7RS79_9AGAR|nr:uncharacterized protein E1B28_012708 [Marasmius oreades]KAG7088740.1 hypothetical protein E1B28_012708 [Marasmius oreades]